MQNGDILLAKLVLLKKFVTSVLHILAASVTTFYCQTFY